MEKNMDDLMKKVNEVHSFLLGGGKGRLGNVDKELISGGKEAILYKKVIRKAVDDLDKTKNIFKSKEIMRIREELSKSIE